MKALVSRERIILTHSRKRVLKSCDGTYMQQYWNLKKTLQITFSEAGKTNGCFFLI